MRKRKGRKLSLMDLLRFLNIVNKHIFQALWCLCEKWRHYRLLTPTFANNMQFSGHNFYLFIYVFFIV